MRYNSLNVKIFLVLISLGLFLLTILFVLIIPNMEKVQKNNITKQIENMIHLTTQQLKLATKAIEEQGKSRSDYVQSIIESKVETIHHKLETIPQTSKKEYLESIAKELSCKVYLLDQNRKFLLKTSSEPLDRKNLVLDSWLSIKDQKQTVCPKAVKELIYTKPSHDQKELLVLNFDPRVLNNNNSMRFEFNLKKDIQNSFLLLQEFHKGKIYLMWIDEKSAKSTNKPLYNQSDDRYYNNKYCVSKISNLDFPKTGDLTAKEILNAIDKKPIRHLLDKENDKENYIYPAFTWVRSINKDENRKLLFITTILEEDFYNNSDSSFWKIFPASLVALLLAILVGFFIFRRLFKSIHILANSAYKVNQGDITIRSNIKGDDDIGVLGTTFDKMLDSIEKNIQELDKKVAQRTIELQNSLEEKETLLKEIHHRVKNNLAMTIELIKMQKRKLSDDITKEALSEIQERVFTMELLHRKLYESKDLHSIDFSKYVKELVDDIYCSYQSQKEIKIDMDIDQINMSIEYALPCGLIINEAITNSLKYAFTENIPGKIFISLRKEKEYYILRIGDSGDGISDDIDIYKPKTLGLKLISTIVKNQLLGELEYSKRFGSEFIIRFQVL